MPRCKQCQGIIRQPQTYRVSPKQMRARKFCTKAHFDAYLRAKHLRPVGSVPRVPLEDRVVPDSPYRVATWGQVPARCGICGGIWRAITGGVVCLTCGRDLYVAAELMAVGWRA